jgi:hypothetical protein
MTCSSDNLGHTVLIDYLCAGLHQLMQGSVLLVPCSLATFFASGLSEVGLNSHNISRCVFGVYFHRLFCEDGWF